MRKETINKIALKDPKKRHIEIFSNQRYKDYYVRGRIDQFSHYIYDDELDEDCAAVSYRFAILALVNDTYQERIERQRNRDELAFGLFGNTKKDFLNVEKTRLEMWYRHWDRKHRKIPQEILKKWADRTLVIGLDEVRIGETPYLNESIKAKKEIILLDMDFVLSKIEILFPDSKMIEYAKRTYTIPAFYFPGPRVEYDSELIGWLDDTYELVYFDFDYSYLEKKEYYRILEPIGNLSYEWIKRREVTDRYLERLNRLNERIGDRTYPLTNFCYKFFDDLVDDLTTQKQIGKCRRCGGFFKFTRRNKKACSLKTEGKDCGNQARDHDYYEEHKDKILAKAQERRALSKKLAVRK